MTARRLRICVVVAAMALGLSCTNDPLSHDATGGGTEITNGATVSALVLDTQGAVVTDALVRLRRADYLPSPAALPKSQVDSGDVRTDSSGAFTISPVPFGRYVLEIVAGDSLGRAERFAIDETARYTGTDTIVLESLGALAGTAPATATPQQSLVRIAGTERGLSVQSGSPFQFENVPPGIHMVHVALTDDSTTAGLADSIVVNARQTASTGPIPLWSLGDGMEGYWPLDEVSGSVAGDLSGNSMEGIVSGAGWVDGRRGGALAFDGIDDSMVVPVQVQPAQAGAVAFWIRPDSACLEDRRFRVLGTSSQFEIVLRGHGTVIGLANELCVIGTASWGKTNLLAPAVWQHVVCTYDINAPRLQIYVNGELKLDVSTELAVPPAASLVCGTRAGTGEYFDGALDEIRMYGRSLSPEEVQLLWLAQQ